MDRPAESLTFEGYAARRPRDLALLLLAIGTSPPRLRARDQQADVAGAALRHRVLDVLAALDPEPDDLDAALASIVAEFGDPTGPTRGACIQLRREWGEAVAAPGAWSWLIAEALAQTERGDDMFPRRGRRRGPA